MLQTVDLKKVYMQGTVPVHALRGVNLTAADGEFIVVVGPSGSGKSTLLNLIGGLDTITEGDVVLDGRSIKDMPDRELTLLRRKHIGFVFQFFMLLPTLSAEENVYLPLSLSGMPKKEYRARAANILDRVGLGKRMTHRPHELSGGEQQRVAIARALVYDPKLILADEPTGNLDLKTGVEILTMIRGLAKEQGKTVVLVTHDPKALNYGDRICRVEDGLITEISDPKTLLQNMVGGQVK
jgi:putative ABC transport system ATP-binding protein